MSTSPAPTPRPGEVGSAATAPAGSAEEAVRLLLELRGPMAVGALAEALAALDVEVGPSELDGVLARAGTVAVQGPGGRRWVALDLPDDPDELRAVTLVRNAPPWLLVVLVVTVLLVAAVVLAGLNAGSREGPTLEYRPPVTTGG